ncbi:MAG: hypothetical protein NC313_00385 [Butyrivibrio sp.]|nr:hypothetical protein [Butyrivibrio sp.]
MNIKEFSEAMGEIDYRYVDKAINYRHKRNRYILPLAASLAVFVLCGFAYSAYVYWGVGDAGKIGYNELTKPFRTLSSEQQIIEDDEIFIEKSSLINDYKNVYASDSICVVADNDIIPSIYFSPNYMVIFTKEGEDGWKLNASEELMINFSLNHAQSLELEIGYILNGEYHELSLTKGYDFNATLTATEEGEYYFCITNHSSENAIIEDGEIDMIKGQ